MWSVFFRLIRLFFFVLAFVFFQYNNFAQSIGTLRGSVSDSLSGEALPFANILIENTSFGSAADSKGNFIIAGIPANKLYTVKVSFLGYKSQRYKITLVPDQITNLRAKLSLEAIKMQAIEKTGERYDKPNETDLSLQRISIREIEYLPQGVETCLLYTSPSPRDRTRSRMPSSA